MIYLHHLHDYVTMDLTRRRQGTKIIRVFLLIFLTFQSHNSSWALDGEYALKAEFLYNFTQFIHWPENAFSAPDSAFQLCLVGEDPFGRVLDETVTGEFVGKHPIVVRRIRYVENTPSCHLVFVSTRSVIPFETVLNTTHDSPVLVVGEDPDSAQKGGTIGFRVVNSRIRLVVNLSAARTANLKISSKLLKMSTIVEN
jgi:YfiR/HmsC-like